MGLVSGFGAPGAGSILRLEAQGQLWGRELRVCSWVRAQGQLLGWVLGSDLELGLWVEGPGSRARSQ